MRWKYKNKRKPSFTELSEGLKVFFFFSLELRSW